MGGDIKVKSKVGFGSNMIIVFPSVTCPEVFLVDKLNSDGGIIDKLKGGFGLLIYRKAMFNC